MSVFLALRRTGIVLQHERPLVETPGVINGYQA
jgi:hypothetical protein